MSTAAVMIRPKEETEDISVFYNEDGPIEVLPHCPYHPQIDFYRAARDAFLESQGLVDLQEFVVRDDIIGRKKAVAIEELIYREDMKQFWSGGYALFNCLKEYYDLYTTVYYSENLTSEYARLTELKPMQFGTAAWMAYMQAKTLWDNERYADAGKAFADALFPIKLEDESSIDWDLKPLPYVEPYTGEEVAGYVSGAISSFISEKNSDNLAECLQDQDILLKSFQQSSESIMKRYNADIEDGLAHLHETYESLVGATANCSTKTQK